MQLDSISNTRLPNKWALSEQFSVNTLNGRLMVASHRRRCSFGFVPRNTSTESVVLGQFDGLTIASKEAKLLQIRS